MNNKYYGQGHEAHYRGYTLKHNPYKRFSNEWTNWRQGWNDSNNDDDYWQKIRNIHRNTKRKLKIKKI